MVGGAEAQGNTRLMLAHWCVEPGPIISGCSALGVPGLVLGHQCVGLGPGPSGGQACVPGWLWDQGVLTQSTCWYVGCVPAWLGAWPEASQGGECNQVLVLIG